MKIGERLKKFRTAKGLVQKQLGIMSGLSEPAIRNYELGNRYPNAIQLEKIAGALGISPLAIAAPDFDSYVGLMHSLFQLEDLYGLKPRNIDGRIFLEFDVEPTSAVLSNVGYWNKELESLKNGAISQEEYDEWRYSFPRLEAERTTEKLRNKRKGR